MFLENVMEVAWNLSVNRSTEWDGNQAAGHVRNSIVNRLYINNLGLSKYVILPKAVPPQPERGYTVHLPRRKSAGVIEAKDFLPVVRDTSVT